MTTTTTLSAVRHQLQESDRFARRPASSADPVFSALVPQGAAAQEWNVPTPVPTDLHNRFWAENPTPPPSTDFDGGQTRTPTPTPVPTNPDDGKLKSSAPTPVPTVPPEDAAALTHRLAYSLLTGIEFQLAGALRGSNES